MAIEKAGSVIGEGIKEILFTPVDSAKEVAKSKSASEFLGGLMESSIKVPFNVFAISMKTSLKVAGLLGKDILRGIGSLPIVPMPSRSKESGRPQFTSILRGVNSTRSKIDSLGLVY